MSAPHILWFAMLGWCWRMHKSAWLLMLLSAGLADCGFPAAQFVFSLLGRDRSAAGCPAAGAGTGHVAASRRGQAAARDGRLQAFLLAYCCGILWYAGTCYWIYNTMRQYGGVGTAGGAGASVSFLFVSCSLSRLLRPADQPAGESGRIGSAIRPECPIQPE